MDRKSFVGYLLGAVTATLGLTRRDSPEVESGTRGGVLTSRLGHCPASNGRGIGGSLESARTGYADPTGCPPLEEFREAGERFRARWGDA